MVVGSNMSAATVLFSAFVSDPAEVRHLDEVLATEQVRVEADLASVGPSAGAGEVLVRNVVANLTAKQGASPPFELTADVIERQVIGYEAFKLERYVTSGVFPKRYFGYLDGKRDTGEVERSIRTTVSATRVACNAWLTEQGEPWRITDAELAVTFLAEGGALWLGDRTDKLGSFHPVFDIGLDDLASGDDDLPGLRDVIDKQAGTNLGGLVAWFDKGATSLPVPTVVPEGERYLMWPGRQPDPPRYPYLSRYMTTEEAVAGTALMWVWEKRIAARSLVKNAETPMEARSLDEQFIVSSLVYNSGRPHKQERWDQIHTFQAASWMAGAAHTKDRSPLPVSAAKDSLAGLIAGGVYPEQNTAWLSGYHVLQRYGGYAALMKFTDYFAADGSLVQLPAVVVPSSPLVETPALVPPVVAPITPPGGCETAPGSSVGAWLAAALLLRTHCRCRRAETWCTSARTCRRSTRPSLCQAAWPPSRRP